MAYQSLYRRYRSQTVEQVLGQDHVTRAQRNAVREGRIAGEVMGDEMTEDRIIYLASVGNEQQQVA